MKIEMQCEVELDVPTLAKVFAALDDEQMCQFFVEVARIAEAWPNRPENQWYYLGGHLRNCECSTEAARDMIDSIHGFMHTSEHS